MYVWEKESSRLSLSLFHNAPTSESPGTPDVVVCETPSLCSQLTVVPTAILRLWCVKFCIEEVTVTSVPVLLAVGWGTVGAGVSTAAAAPFVEVGAELVAPGVAEKSSPQAPASSPTTRTVAANHLFTFRLLSIDSIL